MALQHISSVVQREYIAKDKVTQQDTRDALMLAMMEHITDLDDNHGDPWDSTMSKILSQRTHLLRRAVDAMRDQDFERVQSTIRVYYSV